MVTSRAIMVPLQNISKGAITMDYAYSTTMEAVRKSGKHFTLDERGGKYRHFTAKDSPFAP